MSFDAVTWAKAQPMPFETTGARRRAKAVLTAFAAYVNAEGRGFAAMRVLVIETDLGDERTVQRGLADLKRCGLIEETGDRELFRGKWYPIYRLPLERGPQNTRERLKMGLETPAPRVSPVSPVAEAASVMGDSGDAPTGDSRDGPTVTGVSPKIEDNHPFGIEGKPAAEAREAAARLRDLEALAPPSILRFYDQQIALEAMHRLLADGEDVAVLPEALRRMRAHPDFRSRKHPPQLHDWLRKRGFLGWLADDEDPADPEPRIAPSRTAFAGPAEVFDQLVAAAADAGKCLLGARWREADRTILAPSDWAAKELERRVGPHRLRVFNIRIERAPAE